MAWAVALIPVAMQAVGMLQQGQEGAAQAAHEGQIAEYNARIEEQNAAQARLEAAAAEETQRYQARQAWGRSAAAISQAGIGGPGYGSAGAALTQSAKEAELDALNIRYGGEMEALGRTLTAEQFRLEKMGAKRRARGALTSGMLGAASTTLSGVSNYASSRRSSSGTRARTGTYGPSLGY